MTRSELHELAIVYQRYVESAGYSDELRNEAAEELQRIQARLSEGDFGQGSVISLQVTNHPALTDTFFVGPDRTITLPQIGPISLRGVLQAELDEHLELALASVLREPQVAASPMLRLAVLGEVNTPGFYLIPAGTQLTDVLMTAGGPTVRADPSKLRVERDGERLLKPGARDQGRTVGQLNLQPGDQVVLGAVDPPLPQRLSLLTTTLPLIILIFTTWRQFRGP